MVWSGRKPKDARHAGSRKKLPRYVAEEYSDSFHTEFVLEGPWGGWEPQYYPLPFNMPFRCGCQRNCFEMLLRRRTAALQAACAYVAAVVAVSALSAMNSFEVTGPGQLLFDARRPDDAVQKERKKGVLFFVSPDDDERLCII